jgi:DNA/RNA-binding domain of Phe-tRNA-synthetase-like protein
MRSINISSALKNKIPASQLLCIECDVKVTESPAVLWNLINDKSIELRERLKIEDISQLPAISASRKGYRAAGKDPARYRLSAEALLRRVVHGEELYRISNVVDLLNLVSVSTGFSIGGYDAAAIRGKVIFGIGSPGEPYEGINRGVLNIDGLPVLRDDLGAFGSPTSDSMRSCVNENTTRFLMVIIDFGSGDILTQAGEMAQKLLAEFAEGSNFEIQLIK